MEELFSLLEIYTTAIEHAVAIKYYRGSALSTVEDFARFTERSCKILSNMRYAENAFRRAALTNSLRCSNCGHQALDVKRANRTTSGRMIVFCEHCKTSSEAAAITTAIEWHA